MQRTYLPRGLENHIEKRLGHNPAVVLLGARQVGKSTLAKELLKKHPGALYLDLERALGAAEDSVRSGVVSQAQQRPLDLFR